MAPPEAGPVYRFSPARRADLDLIGRWLRTPHVARWWGEPEKELSDIAGFIDGEGAVRAYIIWMDERAVGYIQSYDIHAEDDHPYNDQPAGSIGIDLSIGDPDLVGKGIGPAVVEAFAQAIMDAGAPRIVIDPHPDNRIAIRAYEKAGFRAICERESVYGPAVIMVRDAPRAGGRAGGWAA